MLRANLNRRASRKNAAVASMQTASPRLLLHLSELARAMTRPLRVQETKGRLVKRPIKNGQSYSFRFGAGRNTVGLFKIDVQSLQELGSLLLLIAEGHDARQAFRQHERKKPSKAGEHQARALAYWSMRALRPAAKDTSALKKARSVLPGGDTLSSWTIRKMAQKHREWALQFLRFGPKIKPIKAKGGKTIRLRTPEQVAALRDYLRKKSARDSLSHVDENP